MGNDVDVLVVEDEEDVRSSLAQILRLDGLEVKEAANGLVALDDLRSTRVRVVLLDLSMPVLDGLSLLDKLDEPPVVILLTARTGWDFEIQKRRSKIARYLQKPCHPHQLLATVRDVLPPDARPDVFSVGSDSSRDV